MALRKQYEGRHCSFRSSDQSPLSRHSKRSIEMSKIIAVLALAMALAVPMSASAATGKAFMHGIQNPEHLAKMIEACLLKDSTGKSLLDPAKCDSDGSCGSAFTFLEGLQKHPAGKHLTDVAQVPGF